LASFGAWPLISTRPRGDALPDALRHPRSPRPPLASFGTLTSFGALASFGARFSSPAADHRVQSGTSRSDHRERASALGHEERSPS
jgi:hypothetical protein